MSSGIRFNSVTTFIEQVGKRIITKFAELDQLTSIWIGPGAAALQFEPKIQSPHPNYPFMFCTDTQITYKEASVAEVTGTYQGLMNASGKLPLVTNYTISTSATQGSRDFQTIYYAQISPATFTQNPTAGGTFQTGPVIVYGTQKINARYIGNQVSIKYFIYPKPANLETNRFGQLGLSLVSCRVISEYAGEITATGLWNGPGFDPSIVMHGIPQTTPPIIKALVGVSYEEIGLWYRVTEEYGVMF